MSLLLLFRSSDGDPEPDPPAGGGGGMVHRRRIQTRPTVLADAGPLDDEVAVMAALLLLL